MLLSRYQAPPWKILAGIYATSHPTAFYREHRRARRSRLAGVRWPKIAGMFGVKRRGRTAVAPAPTRFVFLARRVGSAPEAVRARETSGASARLRADLESSHWVVSASTERPGGGHPRGLFPNSRMRASSFSSPLLVPCPPLISCCRFCYPSKAHCRPSQSNIPQSRRHRAFRTQASTSTSTSTSAPLQEHGAPNILARFSQRDNVRRLLRFPHLLLPQWRLPLPSAFF